MHEETVERSEWGHRGGPWEFNLRDIFRWCELLIRNQVKHVFVLSKILLLLKLNILKLKLFNLLYLQKVSYVNNLID